MLVGAALQGLSERLPSRAAPPVDGRDDLALLATHAAVVLGPRDERDLRSGCDGFGHPLSRLGLGLEQAQTQVRDQAGARTHAAGAPRRVHHRLLLPR